MGAGTEAGPPAAPVPSVGPGGLAAAWPWPAGSSLGGPAPQARERAALWTRQDLSWGRWSAQFHDPQSLRLVTFCRLIWGHPPTPSNLTADALYFQSQ